MMFTFVPASVLSVGLAVFFGMGAGGGKLTFAHESEPIDPQFQATGTIVLNHVLRANDFILLKDVTPLQVVGGHVAMKVPCNRTGETPLKILAGSASETGSALVPVELELIQDLSQFGRECVYHADMNVVHILEDILVETGRNDVVITDIALLNSGNHPVGFGRDTSSSVTVNLLTVQGEGDHHE